MTTPLNFDDLFEKGWQEQVEKKKPAVAPPAQRRPIPEVPSVDRFGEERKQPVDWNQPYRPGVIGARNQPEKSPAVYELPAVTIRAKSGNGGRNGLASAIAQVATQTAAGVDTPPPAHYDEEALDEVRTKVAKRAAEGDPAATAMLAQLDKQVAEYKELRNAGPWSTFFNEASLGLTRSRREKDLRRAIREDIRSGRAVTPEELRQTGDIPVTANVNVAPPPTGGQEAAAFAGSTIPFVGIEAAAGRGARGIAALLRSGEEAGAFARGAARAIEYPFTPMEGAGATLRIGSKTMRGIGGMTDIGEALGKTTQGMMQGQVAGAVMSATDAAENDESMIDAVKAGIAPYAAYGAMFGAPLRPMGVPFTAELEANLAAHRAGQQAARQAIQVKDVARENTGQLPLSDKNPEAQYRGIASLLDDLLQKKREAEVQQPASVPMSQPEIDAWAQEAGNGRYYPPVRSGVRIHQEMPPVDDFGRPIPEQPSFIDQFDMSKNLEQQQAKEAEIAAIQQTAAAEDARPRSPEEQVATVAQDVEHMPDNDLITLAKSVAERAQDVGENVVQRVRKEVAKRGLEAKLGVAALGLTAIATSDDEDRDARKMLALGALGLTTGREHALVRDVPDGLKLYTDRARDVSPQERWREATIQKEAWQTHSDETARAFADKWKNLYPGADEDVAGVLYSIRKSRTSDRMFTSPRREANPDFRRMERKMLVAKASGRLNSDKPVRQLFQELRENIFDVFNAQDEAGTWRHAHAALAGSGHVSATPEQYEYLRSEGRALAAPRAAQLPDVPDRPEDVPWIAAPETAPEHLRPIAKAANEAMQHRNFLDRWLKDVQGGLTEADLESPQAAEIRGMRNRVDLALRDLRAQYENGRTKGMLPEGGNDKIKELAKKIALMGGLIAAAKVASQEEGDDEKSHNLLLAAGALIGHGVGGNEIMPGREWYSRLQRAVENMPKAWDEPRSAKDWMGKLGADQQFSKKEYEVALKPFLEAKAAAGDKVSKQEIVDQLTAHGIHIDEHRYGATSGPNGEPSTGSPSLDEELLNAKREVETYDNEAQRYYRNVTANFRTTFPHVSNEVLDEAIAVGARHENDPQRAIRYLESKIKPPTFPEVPLFSPSHDPGRWMSAAEQVAGVISDNKKALPNYEEPWSAGNLMELLDGLKAEQMGDRPDEGWIITDRNGREHRYEGAYSRAAAIDEYVRDNFKTKPLYAALRDNLETEFEWYFNSEQMREDALAIHSSLENEIPEEREDYVGQVAGARSRTVKGPTEYHGYQRVPGGKNYREIALQWENRGDLTGRDPFIVSGHDYWRGEGDIAAHLRMSEHIFNEPKTGPLNTELNFQRSRLDELTKRQADIVDEIESIRNGRTDEELLNDPESTRLARLWQATNAAVLERGEKIREVEEQIAKESGKEPETVLNAFEQQSSWSQHAREAGVEEDISPERKQELERQIADLHAERSRNAAKMREISQGVEMAVQRHLDSKLPELLTKKDQVAEKYQAALDVLKKAQEGPDAYGEHYDAARDAYDQVWNEHDLLARKIREERERVRIETNNRLRNNTEYIALRDRQYQIDQQADQLADERWQSSRVPDSPFLSNEAVHRLTAAKMLTEAAEGDFDRVAWSDSENRQQLAHLDRKASQITYDQEIPKAVKWLFNTLKLPKPNIEKIELGGYGHWSIKLSPEVKEKIKKLGFPILSAMIATGIASRQASASDNGDTPSSNHLIDMGLLAAGVLVVRKGTKRGGEYEYFEHRSPKNGLKSLDARYMGTGRPGAEVARPRRPKMLHVQDIGSRVEPQFLRDNLYYIRVPKGSIYDASKDPEGIVSKLIKAFGYVDADKMERAIQKAGWLGYRVSEGQAPEYVKLFGQHKTIPQSEVPLPKKLAKQRAPEPIAEMGGGVKLYSNPVGPALDMIKRSPKAASLAVLGIAAAQTDEDDPTTKYIHRMSVPLIGLAALNMIGSRRLAAGGGKLADLVVNNLKDSESGRDLVHFIAPSLLLPPEINAALEARERTISKGMAIAKEGGKAGRDLGGRGDREVQDVLDDEQWEGMNGPTVKGVMSVAEAYAQQYRTLTDEAIRSGALPAEYAQPNYSGRRTYAEYEALDTWKNDAASQNIPGGSKRIATTKQRTLDIPIREAQARLSEAEASGDPQLIKEAQDALGEAQYRQLDTRLALGEIREGSYRFETTIAKGYLNVANADFLKVASQTEGMVHPEWKKALDDFETAREMRNHATSQGDYDAAQQEMDRAQLQMSEYSNRFRTRDPRGKWVSLPDTPGLGALRGAVVDRALFTELGGAGKEVGEGRLFGELLHFWKQMHTVFNPGTNLANIVANIPILHMAGVNVLRQPKWITAAIKDLRSYGEGTKRLTEDGVLDLNFTNVSSEGASPLHGREEALRELYKTTTPETQAVLRERSQGLVEAPDKLATKIKKDVAEPVQSFYNSQDNVFRVALYLARRAEGATADVAAKEARDAFGNFRTRSPLLRVVRGSISPFVMWPVKVLPAVAKNVIDHPYRYMQLVALGAALDEISRHAVGEIPDEDIDTRDERKWGYFFPGLTQLPYMDKEGRRAALDLSRWTPFANATDIANPGTTAAAISDRFPRVFTPNGPALDLWNITANNYDAYRQRPKYYDTSGALGVAGAVSRDLLKAFAPPAVGFHAFRVGEDLKNNDPTAAWNDAFGFIGARPRFTTPGDVEYRANIRYKNDKARLKQELNYGLRKSHSPARDEELFDTFDKQMDRAWELYSRRSHFEEK